MLTLSMAMIVAGCSAGAPPPPPPPTLGALYFSWGTINNPFPACPFASGPCNNYLVILDKTQGQVVTSPNPGTNSYTLLQAPAGALHQYALYTHILNPDGTSSDSEQTLAVSTTP